MCGLGAFLHGLRRLDVGRVAHQVRLVLRRLAAEKAVEILEVDRPSERKKGAQQCVAARPGRRGDPRCRLGFKVQSRACADGGHCRSKTTQYTTAMRK